MDAGTKGQEMTKTELQKIISTVEENHPGSTISLKGDAIYVSAPLNAVQGKEQAKPIILAAKTELKNALLEAFAPTRKFYHLRVDKATVWTTGYENMGHFHRSDIVCGIRIGLTESEHRTLLTGGGAALFQS